MPGLKDVPVPGSGSFMRVVAALCCVLQGGVCLCGQSVGDPLLGFI